MAKNWEQLLETLDLIESALEEDEDLLEDIDIEDLMEDLENIDEDEDVVPMIDDAGKVDGETAVPPSADETQVPEPGEDKPEDVTKEDVQLVAEAVEYAMKHVLREAEEPKKVGVLKRAYTALKERIEKNGGLIARLKEKYRVADTKMREKIATKIKTLKAEQIADEANATKLAKKIVSFEKVLGSKRNLAAVKHAKVGGAAAATVAAATAAAYVAKKHHDKKKAAAKK